MFLREENQMPSLCDLLEILNKNTKIMKRIILNTAVVLSALAMFSCGGSKELTSVSSSTAPERSKVESLEGDKVTQEISRRTGIEMGEALNEDGTDIVKRPYKWFAGEAKADNKQVAVDMAQASASATISRVFDNIVDSKIEQGSIANNGKVQQAIKSHWEQISQTVLKGCEPYGDVVTQFNKKDKMYSVLAKVGIRGDRYSKILTDATAYKPANLSGADLNSFIKTNKAIIKAAK